MKAVILAGGLGTRLSEETSTRPKPLVEIGGLPILLHIMKIYSSHGINEFIICAGYKAYMIKEYFSNYALHTSDVEFDFAKGTQRYFSNRTEPWNVKIVDTGLETNTGGRLRRVRDLIGDETFCFTYGDGVGDVDITASIKFHRAHGSEATLTSVVPPGRFGALSIDGTLINKFLEKPAGDSGVINAGFFVLEPTVIDRIAGDKTIWEREPLESLAVDRQLHAWHHQGFWQPMDTLRDKLQLENMWESGKAPWAIGF